MEGFIDIHCHILPQTDDGAGSMQETAEMLRLAWMHGTRMMVATPHYKRQFPISGKELLEQRARSVQEEAGKIAPGFRILLGQELYCDRENLKGLREGKVLTMGESDYVLAEFSPLAEYQEIETGLREIQMSGYFPILAHVERYRALRVRPGNVGELIHSGVCIQANACSIRGKSRELRKFLKQLLKKEQIHFISSDAHNAGNRNPDMEVCGEYIRKKYGAGYAEELFYSNAMRMLQNQRVI